MARRGRSLVLRLTLLMAGILVVSFGAWLLVVHRSASATFVESQREVLAEPIRSSGEARLQAALESAWSQGGWAAVTRYAASRAAETAGDPAPFLVVDSSLGVRAASSVGLATAEVVEEAPGTLRIRLVSRFGGETAEFELTTSGAPWLVSPEGEAWGRLVILPDPPDPAVGSRFAFNVWHRAGLWLLLLVLVSTGSTAWILQRALAPVDRLTDAARELHEGRIPAPVAGTRDRELHELVDAFNTAVETIDRTTRLRRQLVADVAHELRTPVTNLKSLLDASREGLLEADGRFLDDLAAETSLLERLVEDFGQLAQSDAGDLDLRIQEMPLAETVGALLRPLAAGHHAALTVDLPVDLVVRADEERLRQVFGNLVENAARHRPDGLAIRVVREPSGGEDETPVISFLFADNGPGIAPEDRPHVFERFYRAEKSRSRRTGGAGLGLTITRGLLEAMGGSIGLSAPAETGTTFRITLPKA